jgi:hypothetical protein
VKGGKLITVCLRRPREKGRGDLFFSVSDHIQGWNLYRQLGLLTTQPTLEINKSDSISFKPRRTLDHGAYHDLLEHYYFNITLLFLYYENAM